MIGSNAVYWKTKKGNGLEVRVHSQRSFWDKIWKDNQGNQAVWQTPNIWLISWAVFTTLSLFFHARTADILAWLATAALLIWSLLEIVKGASYFRRVLGLVVLTYTVATAIRAL